MCFKHNIDIVVTEVNPKTKSNNIITYCKKCGKIIDVKTVEYSKYEEEKDATILWSNRSDNGGRFILHE